MGISEPSAVIWLQFSFLNKCVKWDILAWISPRNPQNTGSCPQNVSSDYAPDPGSQHITAMERREAKHISYTVFKDGVFFLSPLNTGAFIEKKITLGAAKMALKRQGMDLWGFPVGLALRRWQWSPVGGRAVDWARSGAYCRCLIGLGSEDYVYLVLCARFWWEVSCNWSCSV